MKLLNFGILAALVVSAMALGQPDWGQNNNAPGKRMRQRGRKGRKRFRLGTRKPFANRGDLSNSQVSIFKRDLSTRYLSTSANAGFGNLISDQWVITPAHLVYDCDSHYKEYYEERNELKYIVHDYSCHLKVGVVAQGSDGEGTYQITRFIVNPNWQYYEEKFRGDVNHDIALLKLDRPVKFSTRVSPICLAKPNLDPTKLDLKMSGWLLQDRQSSHRSVLEESNVIVKSNKDCEQTELNQHLTLTENSLCVLPKVGNKNTCQGDSGAPLAYQDEQKRWNLIGFATYGVGCKNEELHMKVENYLDWIKSITGVGAGCM